MASEKKHSLPYNNNSLQILLDTIIFLIISLGPITKIQSTIDPNSMIIHLKIPFWNIKHQRIEWTHFTCWLSWYPIIMDHLKGLSTVFNCWKFCFKITQWWAMVDFITQNGPIFHRIFKTFVVINKKLCRVYSQKLIWVVNTIAPTNKPSFVKIREVT